MKSILRNDTGPQTGATSVGGTAGNTLGNTANTGGNLASNVGQTLGNTASNLGQTAKDFGQTGSLGGLAKDTGATFGQTLGDTGATTANLGKNTMGTVGGTFYDTGSTLGSHSSGSLGQGLSSGFERTGEGLGNLNTGGLGSSSYTSTLQPGHSSGGYQSNDYLSNTGLHTTTWAQEIRMAPTVLMEKIEKPLIVREKVLPQEKIEVQPVIHREREQLEVHEVIQPMHEMNIAPTNVRSATLPAQVKADYRESDANFQTQYRAATTRFASDIETLGVQREFVNKAPILEEHISRKIVEEVQPVLYKETITPTLIEETQPVYEKIVEAPTIYEETRPTVDLGTKMLSQPVISQQLPTTQFTNLSLREPSVIHKETYITKEVFADPTHKANIVSGAPSKHIV